MSVRSRSVANVQLALKMEEGTMSQVRQATSRSQKSQGMDSPLEPPEGAQPT